MSKKMKKVLISLALISLMGMGFTSCKKSCTCKIGGTTTENENMTEEECAAANKGAVVLGGSCEWN